MEELESVELASAGTTAKELARPILNRSEEPRVPGQEEGGGDPDNVPINEGILYTCVRDGPAAHNRDVHEDFRAHVAGRVAWVESVNAPRGAKLRTMLDRIDWSR